jgi:ribokinase
VLRVERRPKPGETVTGADLTLFPGGKGANQVVAAARLGAEASMLGRVGEDAFGAELVENLRNNGVDTTRVESLSRSPTGSAFVTVTPDGENAIIVSPGANRGFGPREVEAAARDIRKASVLVAQLEVNVEAVDSAARLAEESGARFLLNLAPPREVPNTLLRLSDPLVVNEHEAAFLLGDEQTSDEAARGLLDLGPASVVVTLGAEGAVLAAEGITQRFPAPEVEVVDTTGAGDAFVGALAAKLAKGTTLEDAVPFAVFTGAVAVRREGAQRSLPTQEEVAKLSGGPAA